MAEFFNLAFALERREEVMTYRRSDLRPCQTPTWKACLRDTRTRDSLYNSVRYILQKNQQLTHMSLHRQGLISSNPASSGRRFAGLFAYAAQRD